jgi:hypothetical protein
MISIFGIKKSSYLISEYINTIFNVIFYILFGLFLYCIIYESSINELFNTMATAHGYVPEYNNFRCYLIMSALIYGIITGISINNVIFIISFYSVMSFVFILVFGLIIDLVFLLDSQSNKFSVAPRGGVIPRVESKVLVVSERGGVESSFDGLLAPGGGEADTKEPNLIPELWLRQPIS